MPMLLKHLQTLPFSRLVDMGCGTEEFIVELARLRPQAHFIGIDVDESALGEARSRACDSHLDSRGDFVCGECLNVPLAAGSAGVIVFRGLLHHVKEIALALAEVQRVLCEGGFLLVQNGKRMPDLLFEEMNEALSRSGLPREVHPGFDVEELTEELSAHGLMVEEIVEGGTATFATPPYTPKIYSTGLFLLSARKAGHGA